MAKKHRLKVLGEGSYAGGDFSTVRIIGDANITSGINAEKIRVVGEVEIDGDVTAVKARTTGKLEIEGNSTVENFKVTGEVEISGNAKFDNSRVVGKTKVGGSYNSIETKVYGELKVKEDVNCKKIKNMGSIITSANVTAEEFYSKGFCEIGGLLTAENVELRLYKKTKIEEIGGTNINVKKKGFFKKDDCVMISDSIEGDEIKLESTTADVVRGNKVVIGKGCNIKLVEYSGDFQKHESANVEKIVKV